MVKADMTEKAVADIVGAAGAHINHLERSRCLHVELFAVRRRRDGAYQCRFLRVQMLERDRVLYTDLPNETHIIRVDEEYFVRKTHRGDHFASSMAEYVHIRQPQEVVLSEDADLAGTFRRKLVLEYGSRASELHGIGPLFHELEDVAVLELEIVTGEVDYVGIMRIKECMGSNNETIEHPLLLMS